MENKGGKVGSLVADRQSTMSAKRIRAGNGSRGRESQEEGRNRGNRVVAVPALSS